MARDCGPRAYGPLALITLALTLGACAAPAHTDGARSTPSVAAGARAGAAATNEVGLPVTIVQMGDHWFIPAKLTVPVGTTVEWRMTGTQEHDVWAFDGSFHSPTLGPGMRFSHTFTRPGTYQYLCVPHHGDGMYGEVVVVGGP